MSIRGHVVIKENGKYRYIYNYHDSYIDRLAKGFKYNFITDMAEDI